MMKAIVAVFGLLVLLSSASAATTKPCFTSTQGCATARCGFNTTCVEDLTTCTFACKTCAERNLGCATVRCAGTPCTEEPGTCIPTCGIPSTPNPTPTPVCRDGNETFAVGATRKMDCNTCSCRENGQWMCTLMACPLPKVTLCPNGSPQPASTLAMEQDACRRAGCTSTETCIYNTCPNFPILNTPMGVATCVKRACQEDLQGNKVYCGAAPANIWDASGKCPFRICYGPGTCSGGVIDYSLPFPCAPMNDWEGERRCTNFDGTSVALGSQIPKLVESIDATGMITWKADGINVCICQGGMDGPPPRLVCSQAAVVEPTTRAPTTRVPTAKPTTPTPCRACPFNCGFNPAFQCVNDANGCGQCINTATGAPTTPTPCRACPFSCGFNPAFQCVNDANGCGQCVNTAVTTTPPTTPTTSCSVLRGTGNCPLGTACVSGPCPGGLICVDPPGTCQPITCSVLRGTGNCPNGTACVSGPCPGGLICIDPPGTCQPTEPPCRACPFSCGFNPAFQCVNDANGCGQCVNTAGTTRVPTTATPTTPTPACRFGDQTFAVGASRQEDCNTCSCRPNGSWICTLRACPPPDVCATVNPCISTLCPTGTTCEKEVRNGQCEPVCKPMTCSVLRGTGNCPPGTTCVSGPCPGGLICVDPPGTCQPQTCADRFQGCSRVRCDTGLICQEDPKTCAAKCVAKCPSNWISGANQCGRQCSAPTQTCLSHLINQEREHRDDPSVNKYCNVCTKSTLCDASSVAQSFKMTTLRTATKKDVINILNELAKSFLKGSPANTFQLSSNEINVVSTSSRGTVWSVKVFFRNNKCDVKLFWADKYKDTLFEQRGITSTVSTQGVTSSTSFEMTQEDVDTFTTEAATLTTQTCVDGSEISAEQTCPVEEMIVPTTTSSSSSSSSSSTPIAAIVGGIVGGIVLLTLIIATVIIMRRRRHANTIKSIAQETQMTGSEQRV